jgi:hypothetical protein
VEIPILRGWSAAEIPLSGPRLSERMEILILRGETYLSFLFIWSVFHRDQKEKNEFIHHSSFNTKSIIDQNRYS